jgi:hypothetical protein
MVSENAALPLTATASASPAEVCAGSMVQLDVAVAGGSGSYTYQWSSIPAGFTSSVQNPVVLPATSTQYIVHVSDGSGVADSPVDVSVISQATADAGNDTTMAYAANSVPLHGIASSFASALWMTNGTGTFSDQTSLIGDYLPSLADKNSGTVQLSLTSFPISPCFQNAVDVKIVQFDAPTGLRENPDDLMRIEVSPNPSSGKFKISISKSGIFVVTVRNINGLPVIQQHWNGTLNAENLIDLSGFPKGVYFISLMNDRFSGTAKVMIQ